MRGASKLVLLLPMLALGGCAVGFVRVSTPKRLPPHAAPPLEERIVFDVCVPASSPPLTPPQIERKRKALGDRVGKALAAAGVSAALTADPGTAARFTVTERAIEYDHVWSALLSFFTLSVIPGYEVERRTLDVNLAWRDPVQGDRRDHLKYEARVRYFVWVPLLAYPDFVVGPNGGWESSKVKDAGFEGTIARLADDLRDRLGRGGVETPPSDVAGVVCPSATGDPGPR